MNWKDFLYFSRKESIAILFILVIILLTLNLNILLSKRNNSPFTIAENDSLIASFERLNQTMKDKKSESQQINYNERDNTRNSDSQPNKSNQIALYQKENNQREFKYTKQEKLKDSEYIFLNETDTAQWKKVPGIGSAYASRIVKYNKLLGGFTSITQLREVYGIDDELFDNISLYVMEEDNIINKCKKLEVNKLEFKEIVAHPYIDYEQTIAIVNLRRRIGNITSIDELAMLDEFTPEDIIRITPYLQF
ncbi:MAG TPA: helix-hairpin-helix domain-containing protein [Dysgonamonadaceae bacterium]|nr:helix-hairpin-helix domain-containing protein [Dysgonamonadaceae bacterium]